MAGACNTNVNINAKPSKMTSDDGAIGMVDDKPKLCPISWLVPKIMLAIDSAPVIMERSMSKHKAATITTAHSPRAFEDVNAVFDA